MTAVSVALFGSQCRAARDRHSDVDALVVTSLASTPVACSLEASGYSVTTLSMSRLKRMSRHGSLFVQHLRDEARLIVDPDHQLRTVLDETERIAASSDEIERGRLSLNFATSWPNHPTLRHWKADFTYCLARDLLIKEASTLGLPVYGVDALTAPRLRVLGHRRDLQYRLSFLRKAKALYRQGRRSDQLATLSLRGWTKSGTVDTKSQKFQSSSYGWLLDRPFNSRYERLRTLEGCYLLAQSRGLRHPEHDVLLKIIRNPNAYGSSTSVHEMRLKDYLEDVIALLDDV